MASGMLGGLGSGLLSGGLGAISSIFSNKAQAKENQRNRDFTEYMYDKQYDNNFKMWNAQNKYDLPSAQKQRLIDAGLNPDLMYSGKGVSPSPNLQAAVAGSPSAGSLPGYGGVADAFNQGRLLDAQIRNIDADTKQKESQTVGQGYQNEILKSDASFRDALNSGQIDVQGVTVKNLSKDLDVKDANIGVLRQQVINMQKQVEVFNQSLSESSQRIANMKLDAICKQIDNYIKFATAEDVIARIAAESHITQVEAKFAMAKILSQLAVNYSQVNANNAAANASNASARVNNLNWQIGITEFEMRQSAGYYNVVIDADVEKNRSDYWKARRNSRVDKMYSDTPIASDILNVFDGVMQFVNPFSRMFSR